VHTCDKRQSKTWIFNHFNAFDFEPGFAEEDELWDADHRETNDEHVARAELLLTDIFNHDNSSVISFTAHSGMISALLQAVGHRPFPLPTGSIIAVLLKGEWNDLAMSWGSKPTFVSPELRAKAEADQEKEEDAIKVSELIDLAESI
jgi:broad specificity phosphatase PhoE